MQYVTPYMKSLSLEGLTTITWHRVGIVSVGGLDPSEVDIIMGCREKTRGIKSVEFACMSRVFSIL